MSIECVSVCVVKVTIKHGKKKYKNFKLMDSETFDEFQARLFSRTSVPPHRQKLIAKGGVKIVSLSLLSELKNVCCVCFSKTKAI
jgi:hypothetical protein